MLVEMQRYFTNTFFYDINRDFSEVAPFQACSALTVVQVATIQTATGFSLPFFNNFAWNIILDQTSKPDKIQMLIPNLFPYRVHLPA